jgi:hypothetical protein
MAFSKFRHSASGKYIYNAYRMQMFAGIPKKWRSIKIVQVHLQAPNGPCIPAVFFYAVVVFFQEVITLAAFSIRKMVLFKNNDLWPVVPILNILMIW